jgi:hypothetical protein
MADGRIVQKDEAVLGPADGLPLTHKPEQTIAHLPDCGAGLSKTKVAG